MAELYNYRSYYQCNNCLKSFRSETWADKHTGQKMQKVNNPVLAGCLTLYPCAEMTRRIGLTEGSSLKRNQCRNRCDKIPKPKRQGNTHYIYDDRYCETCNRWFFAGTNRFCDCCHLQLRIKPAFKKR